MQRKRFIAIAFALTGLASIAGADTHWMGFTKLSPDGLPDEMQWAWQEGHNFDSSCERINKYFKAQITCAFDREGFKRLYAAEFKHPKIQDRMPRSPDDLCGQHGLDYLSGERALGVTKLGYFCPKDEACRAEFVAKVKSISCVVVAEDAEPRMTLKDGALRLTLTRRPNGDIDDNDGWIQRDALRLFPAYKKVWNSYQ